ncbi:MAG: phosphoribosylglycinamide formyltransferase, partial [Sphaerochaeta sp.]|nr:phosphoribosylglycinamide formyltransferase [Sphaerochaeta sp.]
MIRIAVLVSGEGSNLEALLDFEKRGGNPDGRIVLVIADRSCNALDRAAGHRVTALMLDRQALGKKEFERSLLAGLEQHRIDLVVLAGFLTILSEKVTERYRRRIINIHPSLIPSFCGKGYYGERVHQAALQRGVKVSGATVHLVDEVADGGPILSQQAIEVLDDDTPSSLGRRILEQVEWKLLPKTVASYCLYMERNMSLSQKLAECRYPGRGIVCGMNERGKAIIAYFITARSIHSKNRALVAEGDTVRTK